MHDANSSPERIRSLETEDIVAAVKAAFSEFASDEIHPLRTDVLHLFEYVRGNGRPGLVQQTAVLEERLRTALLTLEQMQQAIERQQQRLYMLVVAVGLALLGALFSVLVP